ncbi:MAG: shikimate dehydrogenase [Actinomycetota bacterium]|nr:shikimate dehydrogenase [Actinomycetota bacterium]
MAEAIGLGPHRVRGSSRTVGIIGWPVAHSLSPAIHNAAFAAMGLDWVYVPLPVEPGGLRDALGGLAALGFAGANVTMPHKSDCADIVDVVADDALRLRAVNTIVVEPAGLRGHNTDAPGFDRFLRRDVGFEPAGRSALMFGAGGAARACGLALARGGLAHLTVVVREPERAEGLRETLEGFDTEISVIAFGGSVEVAADLVVNATPLGARGEELPVPPLGPEVLVIDLLYHPAVTPLLTSARNAGAATFGGLGMLLHQAALSFELWTGQQPPLDVMSAAALTELAEQA